MLAFAFKSQQVRVSQVVCRSVGWSEATTTAAAEFLAKIFGVSKQLYSLRGEWRAQCGDCGNLQKVFARVGERSDAGGQLTWSVVVVPVVDGPGRVAISLAVHGQITVAGSSDAVLGSHGVIVDAAVAGQVSERGGPVRARARRVLGTDVLGS